MRLLALVCVLALVGCDALSDADPFDNPTLDVYELALTGPDGTPEAAARVGLAFYASDVADPEAQCTGNGGLRGPWEVADAEGLALGGVGCGGADVLFELYDSANENEARPNTGRYLFTGTRADGRISGEWTRPGASAAGTFTGRIVREATERVLVP